MVIIIDEHISRKDDEVSCLWEVQYTDRRVYYPKIDFFITDLDRLQVSDVYGRTDYVIRQYLVEKMNLSVKARVGFVNTFNPQGSSVPYEYQRKGIGRYFMNRIEDFCYREETEAIALGVFGLDFHVKEFYKALGFNLIDWNTMCKPIKPNPL